MNSKKNKSKSGIIIVIVSVAALVITALAFLRQGTGIAFLDNIFARKATASGAEAQAAQQQSKEDIFYKLGETFEKNGFRFTARSIEKADALPDSPYINDVCTDSSKYAYFSAVFEVENLKAEDLPVNISGLVGFIIVTNEDDPLYRFTNTCEVAYHSAAVQSGQNFCDFTMKANEKKEIRVCFAALKDEIESAGENANTRLYLVFGSANHSGVGRALVDVTDLVPKTQAASAGMPKLYQLGETCESGGLRFTLNSAAKVSALPKGVDKTRMDTDFTPDYKGNYLSVTVTVENPGSVEAQRKFSQLMILEVVADAAGTPKRLTFTFPAYYTNQTRDASEAPSGGDAGAYYEYVQTFRFPAGGKETVTAYYPLSINLTEERLQDALSGGNHGLYLEVGEGIQDVSGETKIPWPSRTLFEIRQLG